MKKEIKENYKIMLRIKEDGTRVRSSIIGKTKKEDILVWFCDKGKNGQWGLEEIRKFEELTSKTGAK